jgi:uncharacterized membrane protein
VGWSVWATRDPAEFAQPLQKSGDPRFMLNLVGAITQHELAEGRRDAIANYLLHAAQSFSVSTQHFTAIYLLSHGIIKLWLIAGLLRKRLWYYPAAILIFGLFIVYQLYRFSFTYSVLLLLITALDLLVIILTWQEAKYLRHSLQP